MDFLFPSMAVSLTEKHIYHLMLNAINNIIINFPKSSLHIITLTDNPYLGQGRLCNEL